MRTGRKEERDEEKNKTCISIATANARSVDLKLDSVYSLMNDGDIDVLLLTETWVKSDRNLNRIKDDIVERNGFGFIHYNRPGKRNGGGVAIIYNRSKLTLEENKFRRDGIEVVSAKGKIKGDTRTFACYSIYLPPNLTQARVNHASELINDNITKIKTEYDGPLIALGGDINQFGIKPLHSDHNEIQEVSSPPTRMGSRLDLISTNFNSELKEVYLSSPLESSTSVSDHDVLVTEYVIKHNHRFKLVKYQTRSYTKKAESAFLEEIKEIKWEERFGNIKCASALTDIFQGVVGTLVDKHFPIRTRTVKSTDDPWINDRIRRLIRRRKKEYRKNGRSLRWKRLKAECEREIAAAKKDYYNGECTKMTTKGAHKVAFNALKNINKPYRQSRWDISELYQELERPAILENLADFFNRISVEFPPLTDADRISTYDREMVELTEVEVRKKIRVQETKKHGPRGHPATFNRPSN